MRRLTSLLALAVATLTTLLAPAAVEAAPTGSITGTVTDAATHLPIAGVRVCAASEGQFEEAVEEFCAHSAANGAYAIGELPEGWYTVEFISSAEGLNYAYQAWKGKSEPFEANLVKVTTGEVAGIDAALEEGGMIEGRVTSFSSGAPVAGVEVCAEPMSADGLTVCATTDGAGQYTMVGLSDGGYLVGFLPPEQLEFLSQHFDREPGVLQADLVEVRTGQLTPNVNATLLEGGQIAGQVTDAVTHAPLVGANACASTALGNRWLGTCGESGADGRYLIRRVPAGIYTVRFFPPESASSDYVGREYTGICGKDPVAVTVAAGALTAGIDIGLFPLTSGGTPPECTAVTQRPPSAAPIRKSRRCRKGTRRKIVRGKRRCVRVRKHRHRHRHAARRS